MKNQTKYYLTPKDDGERPFNRYDAKLWTLTNNELLIMLAILSNKTEKRNPEDEIWILNRCEIQRRLQKGGMGDRVFRKAWNSLKKKKYINCERKKGYVIWTIWEDPDMNINPILNPDAKPVRPAVYRGPHIKTKEIKTETPKKTSIPYYENPNLTKEEYDKLGHNQKNIWKQNFGNPKNETGI